MALLASSALAITLACDGTAAAASFPFNVFHYRVGFAGSGSYGVTAQNAEGGTAQVTASFHWKVRYDLLFIYHRGHQLGAVTQPKPAGGGTWSLSFNNVSGQTCAGSGALALDKYGALTGSIQRDGTVVIWLFPGAGDFGTTGGSNGTGFCQTGDFWSQWVQGFSKVGSGAPQLDPVTALIGLTPGQLRRKTLSFRVSNQSLFEPQLTINADCGSGDGGTCSQSFGWTGTVSLTRLAGR